MLFWIIRGVRLIHARVIKPRALVVCFIAVDRNSIQNAGTHQQESNGQPTHPGPDNHHVANAYCAAVSSGNHPLMWWVVNVLVVAVNLRFESF